MTIQPETPRKDVVLLLIGEMDLEIYALGQILPMLRGREAKKTRMVIANLGTSMMMLTEEYLRITHYQTTGAM
jgi:hypothetical protein